MTMPLVDATWRFQGSKLQKIALTIGAVSSSEEFDHLRNPSYFTVRHEPTFQREIVELKNVCWLRFCKRLGRHRPGHYSVRLRVYVGPETNWQNGASCILSVNKNQSLKNGCVTNDGGNWQLIEIGPFQLQNDSDLEFQFVDTVNPCWKSGMKWDYIELRLNAQTVSPDPMVPMEATWRFPVADAEEFDHRDNPAHIVVKRDPQLGRDVVELINVYWLNFRKKLGTHGPGSYQAKLRFHVGPTTDWTFGAPCNISVNKIERSPNGEVTSRHPIVIVSVPSKLWSTIATDRINHSFLPRVIQERMPLLPNGNVINDGDFWFILELERFKINTGSSNVELEFSFRDVENGGRKAGMKWDYIELKKN